MNGTNVFTFVSGQIPLFDLGTQLLISIIGAGAGAYFGLVLARRWDRRKRQEEINQTEKDTINSLLDEMSNNNQKLKSPRDNIDNWTQVIGYEQYRVLSLSKTAFDSVVNSGNFSLLPKDMQTKVSKLYLSIEYCNSLAEKMENIHATHVYGFNRPQADNLINSIWHILDKKYEELKITIDSLSLELSRAIS